MRLQLEKEHLKTISLGDLENIPYLHQNKSRGAAASREEE